MAIPSSHKPTGAGAALGLFCCKRRAFITTQKDGGVDTGLCCAVLTSQGLARGQSGQDEARAVGGFSRSSQGAGRVSPGCLAGHGGAERPSAGQRAQRARILRRTAGPRSRLYAGLFAGEPTARRRQE